MKKFFYDYVIPAFMVLFVVSALNVLDITITNMGISDTAWAVILGACIIATAIWLAAKTFKITINFTMNGDENAVYVHDEGNKK